DFLDCRDVLLHLWDAPFFVSSRFWLRRAAGLWDNRLVMVHLDDKQLKALSAQPHKPLKVDDKQAHISFYVFSADAFQYVQPFLIDRSNREAELRRELQAGLDDIQRGDVAPLDMASIKREGRDSLKRRSSVR